MGAGGEGEGEEVYNWIRAASVVRQANANAHTLTCKWKGKRRVCAMDVGVYIAGAFVAW